MRSRLSRTRKLRRVTESGNLYVLTRHHSYRFEDRDADVSINCSNCESLQSTTSTFCRYIGSGITLCAPFPCFCCASFQASCVLQLLWSQLLFSFHPMPPLQRSHHRHACLTPTIVEFKDLLKDDNLIASYVSFFNTHGMVSMAAFQRALPARRST